MKIKTYYEQMGIKGFNFLEVEKIAYMYEGRDVFCVGRDPDFGRVIFHLQTGKRVTQDIGATPTKGIVNILRFATALPNFRTQVEKSDVLNNADNYDFRVDVRDWGYWFGGITPVIMKEKENTEEEEE